VLLAAILFDQSGAKACQQTGGTYRYTLVSLVRVGVLLGTETQKLE